MKTTTIPNSGDDPIPELVQGLGGAAIDAGRRDRGLDALIPTAPRRCGAQSRYLRGHADPLLEGCELPAGHPMPHMVTTAGDRIIRWHDEPPAPREPETVAEALEDVHRRYCPEPDTFAPHRFHDPVCRILSAHVRNLEAALEAGRKREPVALAGSDGDRDGVTFTPEFDRDRLNRQAGDVYDALTRGRPTWDGPDLWWTLRELADATGHPEASVSARIRDLRKPRFGGLTIERRRRGEGRGTWEYRLVPPCPRDHAGPCFSDPRLCAKILTDARAAQVTP